MPVPFIANGRERDFAQALVQAGNRKGSGIAWRPFVSRQRVEALLAQWEMVLVEDGANHDPKLRRFFAVDRERPEPVLHFTDVIGHGEDRS